MAISFEVLSQTFGGCSTLYYTLQQQGCFCVLTLQLMSLGTSSICRFWKGSCSVVYAGAKEQGTCRREDRSSLVVLGVMEYQVFG